MFHSAKTTQSQYKVKLRIFLFLAAGAKAPRKIPSFSARSSGSGSSSDCGKGEISLTFRLIKCTVGALLMNNWHVGREAEQRREPVLHS